ncbi:hydrogenase maturation protein [Endozoicomonas sp. SM1973]|uniref:Hydrogenase maturation protein n=1 Tax=Spartinivicinus marinus TaxID=2994442 RepID=A0A853IGY1_9GAMM|nr:enoyl-CoA hydratase-related protein [Spartinivicinus marinus]MCX4026454.1 enoyl-CoA hydratase-related protein [Spartinivicinus marinus]NYZ66826.1 hydrogenase maturation protein [Spartinivicinus marinus]
MKILLLVSAFNGLSQRVYAELRQRNYWVSVEYASTEQQMKEAVALFEPELVICPFLKQAIPRSIWQHYLCWIVHPGIKGDRGPSALDWAIYQQKHYWGVTLVEAAEEYDAGDIWGSQSFKLPKANKSTTYRHQITEAAVELILTALKQLEAKTYKPEPLDYTKHDVKGNWQPLMKQNQRSIDWQQDSTTEILAKLRAAESFPGVKDLINGKAYYLFNAHQEKILNKTRNASPGEIIAQKSQAICRATRDGAIWLTHLKQVSVVEPKIKLPAAEYLADHLQQVPELVDEGLPGFDPATWQDIHYEEDAQVGYLHFNFYNGAMSTGQCYRLLKAYREALERPTQVLVLMGGTDFWANGINLNTIEASPEPGLEAWENLKQINDLVEAILTTENKLTIAALKENAAAGGVMLALACDKVLIREGVILSPYYQHMGLYGSEYWSFNLPRRVGEQQASKLMANCLPLLATEAVKVGLADEVLPSQPKGFLRSLHKVCEWYSHKKTVRQLILRKQQLLRLNQQLKPLKQYREEEEAKMWQCFMAPESAFHQARKQFVYKLPVSAAPSYLAVHRQAALSQHNQQKSA